MSVSRRIVAIALLSASATAAQAQTFNQALVFGDSNVDSGFYRALPNPGGGNFFNNNWAAAVAAGAGIPTSSPGLMNSEVLARYFGLTAHPSNQPGGTNYATSGAKNVLANNAQTGGFTQAIPTVQQFANYLAATGGIANANGLYLINSGANDITYALGGSGAGPFPTDPIAFLKDSATGLAQGITLLSKAGARYIVVPGQAYSFGNQQAQQARYTYTSTLWSQLSANGVNFIPADINAVRVAIAANPSSFGFEFIDTNDQHTACTRPNPAVGNAYSLLCSALAGAPSHLANQRRTRRVSLPMPRATFRRRARRSWRITTTP